MLGEGGEWPGEECDVVERNLRRGWYVGSESFGKELAGQMEGTGDNLRGTQRRAHDIAEAERLLDNALSVLGLEEGSLKGMKSTVREKQAIAWLLKKHTTVTGVWIADRLGMGHRVNASRAISVIEKEIDSKAIRLKRKMLQCTG